MPQTHWIDTPAALTAAIASRSACGSPAPRCQPAPISMPSFTTTAPTGGFGDVLNRYKLEQTIRQLHGIHSTDPRASFGANFSGV